ncbi:MAG: SIS domain-containing protein, partial [Anaerolineae bacterium]
LLQLLSNAKRVWVIGEAMGRYLAELFASYLRVAGVNAAAVDADPAAVAHMVLDLDPDDLVIGLGVAGTGLDTAAALRLAQEQGATIAAVSVSALSPPAQVADHVLVCPSTTPMGLSSNASLMTMLTVLWQAILARDEMEERVNALQETYASLLEARGKQRERLDVLGLWQEF